MAIRSDCLLKSVIGSLWNGARPIVSVLVSSPLRDDCFKVGFMSKNSSGTFSRKLARRNDSFEVFSRSRRTR